MLFDLRGRGRRRTVKVVYITLAFLMGGGLVLFGIGGGGAMRRPRGRHHRRRRRRHRRRALREARARRAAHDRRQPGGRGRLGRARPRARPDGRHRRELRPHDARPTRTPARPKLRAAAEAWNAVPRARPQEPRRPRRGPDGAGVRPDAASTARRTPSARRRSSPRPARATSTFATLADLRLPGRPDPQGRPRPRKALELAPKDERNTLKSQLDQAKQQAVAAAAPAGQPAARRRRAPSADAQARIASGYHLAPRALVAQLAEQRTLNPKVPGSIPGGGTYPVGHTAPASRRVRWRRQQERQSSPCRSSSPSGFGEERFSVFVAELPLRRRLAKS